MKLIIDIPESMYNFVNTKRPNGYFNEFDKFDTYDISKCVRNGIPLPKGHGRLIDMKDLRKLVTEYCDAEQLILADREDYLPTIIEADEGE